MAGRVGLTVLAFLSGGLHVALAARAQAQAPATRPAGGGGLFEDLGHDEPGAPTPPAQPPRPGGAPPAGQAPGLAKPPAGGGRSVTFLLDISASAEAAAAARRECGSAIRTLPEGYQFRMFATRGGAVAANGDGPATMGTGPADPARAAALAFAAEVAPAARSEVARLLPAAMTPPPNLLYLLVDRKSDLPKAQDLLKSLNAERRARVNVILFEDGRPDAGTLAAVAAIARDHGGTYRRSDAAGVSPPGATPTPAGTTGPGGATTTKPTPTVAAANGQAVNLIPLVDVDRDAIAGRWTTKGSQLACVEGSDARLRLPYKPPPQYDLVVEFTVTEPSDFNAACLLATHQLSSYGFYVGTAKNTVAGFGNVQGRSPTANQTAYRSPDMIEKGRRHQAMLRVRTDSVTGWLDGRMVSELPLTAPGITLDRVWRVGSDAIGVGTTRKATFHVVRLVGHEGEGQPVKRYRTGAVAPVRPSDPARTVRLTDREPIAVQTGWDRLGVNRAIDDNPVVVRGKPCDRFLFAHAPSSLIYQVPDGAVAFRAVGVKPAGKFNPKEGDFRYFVHVDGDEAFVSRGINAEKGTIDVHVPIPKGARRIELRVDQMGSNRFDHAVWANPEFLMAPR